MPAQPASSDKSHHQNFIPPAVRAQAQRAQELMEGKAQPTPEEPVQGQQEGQVIEHEPQQPQRREAAPEPPKAPPEPSQQEQKQPDYEHLLSTEKGRVQRFREDLRLAQEEIQNLHRLLATTRAAPPPQQEEAPSRLLSAEEMEEWKELLPIVEKRAKELIAPLQQDLNSKIEQVNRQLQGLGQATQVDQRQRMFDLLDNNPAIQGWRDINTDQEFLGWLSHTDPYTGQRRHDLLTMAFESNSASRVAAFFESFLREQGGTPQPAPRQGSQPGNGAAPPAKPSLETYAAPGKARTVAPPAAPARETISRAQIDSFFKDVVDGKYRGRDDEKKRLEQEIFLAMNEGRIT